MPDTATSEPVLDDLVDRPLLQGLVDAASEAWGLRFTVFRADGTPWERRGRRKWFCAEMREIRQVYTCKCQESDRRLINLLRKRKPWLIERCGLEIFWEIAAPIVPEDRGFIGAIMVGGIRDKETTVEQVLEKLGISGAEAEQLKSVFADTVKEFDAEDRDGLRDFVVGLATLAQQLVEARDRVVVTAETLRRAQEDAQGVLELSTQVGRKTKVGDVLREVVEGARRAMEADRGGLSLYDRHSSLLRIEVYLPEDMWERIECKKFSTDSDSSLHSRVLATQKALVVPDVHYPPEGMRAQPTSPDVHGIVLAPLSVGDQRLGVLWVDSDEVGAFTDADKERLSLFAAYSAIAIQNALTLQQRDQFMLFMTHQLASPLGAVRGLAGRLADRLSGRMNSPENTLARRIEAHAGIASNTALKFAGVFRLLSGEPVKLTKSPQSILLVIMSQVTLYKYVAQDQDVRFEVAESALARLPRVPMDPDLMRHVFMVLVDNAIKYSIRESSVWISGTEGDGYVSISVSNVGLGIGEGEYDRVFELGYRTREAKAIAPTGTGIGLSIARRIVELHQGKISVSSTPTMRGHRTVFTVRLPV